MRLRSPARVGAWYRGAMGSGPSQHYMFCHDALPSVFFADPGRFFRVLGGPDRQLFLTDLWEEAGKRGAPETRRDPAGLRGAAIRRGPHLFALIYLPEPAEATECYFVCMIAGVSSDGAALAWGRVFTLELGEDVLTGEACTFLGEWTPEAEHHNLGDGPKPDANAFVAQVLKAVAGEPSAKRS